MSTRTGFKLQLLKNAVLSGRPTARGLIVDYLRSFAIGLEDFRFKTEDFSELNGEKVRASIHRFLPYKDEFVEFISFVSLYIDDHEVYRRIYSFFESLLQYGNPPAGTSGFDQIADNFLFIQWELFLYLIAALIKNQRFEIVDIFLGQEYFDANGKRTEHGESYVNFTAFCQDSYFIEIDRSGRPTGGMAKLLRERALHGAQGFD